jgi:hypothetical protein
LKIDVEGFENDVLIGASDVLKNVLPDAIVLETNEQNQPSFRERRAVKTLRQFFYRFLSIPKAKLLMRAKPFDEDTIQDPGLDVIAVPEEKFVEIEKAVGRDFIIEIQADRYRGRCTGQGEWPASPTAQLSHAARARLDLPEPSRAIDADQHRTPRWVGKPNAARMQSARRDIAREPRRGPSSSVISDPLFSPATWP